LLRPAAASFYASILYHEIVKQVIIAAPHWTQVEVGQR
jgi:hypothetical protein